MYIWNGYTVIGKHKDLTEGMLKTLDEAQAQLDNSPSELNYVPSLSGLTNIFTFGLDAGKL